MSEINSLVAIQQQSVQARLEEAQAAASRLQVLLYIVAFASLVFGAACAWILTRSITHPLRDAVTIARRVASGDLSSRQDVEGSDEVSELLRALDEMTGALTEIVSKVRGGVDAVDVA